jgi:hypothetical protein
LQGHDRSVTPRQHSNAGANQSEQRCREQKNERDFGGEWGLHAIIQPEPTGIACGKRKVAFRGKC